MHKQLDVAERPRVSASVYVHVPLFATVLMSVINLLVEASACLLPWVSLFICTPALIMAVAEREEAGTFYTELTSLQSSYNYCCYAIVRLTLKMEWDLKCTATKIFWKHFLTLIILLTEIPECNKTDLNVFMGDIQ